MSTWHRPPRLLLRPLVMAIMGRGRLYARMVEQFVHGDEIAVVVVQIARDGVMNVFVHERCCWHRDCLCMTTIINDTYVV